MQELETRFLKETGFLTPQLFLTEKYRHEFFLNPDDDYALTKCPKGDRLVISGGSAGGYTTLCALTFRDTFKAGASYYGVSDLEALAQDTHKFESRYLDRLVAAYPQQRQLYQERSPVHFTDRLTCPVIFFQGP